MTVLPVILPGSRRPLGTAAPGPKEGPGASAVIGVASARGGMGRTLVATALAARCVRRGSRVLLVDADLDVGSLSLLVGPQTVELGHGDLRFRRAVPGALDADALRSLSNGEEVVIADLPLWAEPPAHIFAGFDTLFFVTDPEPASVAASARWIRRYRDSGKGLGRTLPLSLILNRVRRGDDVEIGHALARSARELGVDARFVGVLPWDDGAWIRARRPSVCAPLDEDAPFGHDVDEMLERLESVQEVPAPGPWREELVAAAAAGQGARLAAVAQVG